jgi:hypothetical protein
MTTNSSERQTVETFEFRKEIEIAAPIEITFETVLGQLGPEGEMPGGKPFPMTFEAWPGGRWFRDLGDNAGHLWGHVQVIKPPTLLEICGPLMMSFAATNHVQYRLKADGDTTRIEFSHSAIGLIPPEHREGLPEGWGYWLEHIREMAEHKNRKEAKK